MVGRRVDQIDIYKEITDAEEEKVDAAQLERQRKQEQFEEKRAQFVEMSARHRQLRLDFIESFNQYGKKQTEVWEFITEISDEALDIAHELIRSNTLYKGQEWEHAIQGLEDYKARVRRLTPVGLDRFVWLTAGRVGPGLAKIRNHSIGVLLTDLSNGMDEDSVLIIHLITDCNMQI